MKTITETEKVGIHLALGYSKKEVASKLRKSVNTVSKQADIIYKETESHNLADLVRKLVKRYTGIPVEDVLINAMKDTMLVVAVAFLVWALLQPEVLQKVSTSIGFFFNNK